jgi:hypothetical protein
VCTSTGMTPTTRNQIHPRYIGPSESWHVSRGRRIMAARMRLVALFLLVGALTGACSIAATQTSHTSTPQPTADQALVIENRGGPDLDVYIDDKLIASVPCGAGERIDVSNAPLPWELEVLRVADKEWTLQQRVTRLPLWLEQLGSEAPFLSDKPVLGPFIACPSAPPQSTPQASDPYAGLPSNACGGFHLKIVNNSDRSVQVGINGTWTETVGRSSTNVVNYMFSTPRPPEMPWNVVVSESTTGRTLLESTLDSPVDQKLTISDEGATQAPYDLMAEGC